ncbi:hypothetical protein RNJ44_02072 [Nakaseomyces bracarensis]|uniref:RWD domain-containing protein n=1 Tax=Nakaseomyces bracarensis TaxID=273131 RepID=A0ABR4NML1_9SACH
MDESKRKGRYKKYKRKGKKNEKGSVGVNANANVNVVRDEQVAECVHVLKSYNFKLFKAGDYVNSYNLSVREPRAARHTKFQVLVPHNYPQSALKVSLPQERVNRDTVARNFNLVSRRWTKDGVPMVSQLNLLVSTLDELSSENYPKLLEMKQQLFSKLQ